MNAALQSRGPEGEVGAARCADHRKYAQTGNDV